MDSAWQVLAVNFATTKELHCIWNDTTHESSIIYLKYHVETLPLYGLVSSIASSMLRTSYIPFGILGSESSNTESSDRLPQTIMVDELLAIGPFT